LPVAVLPLKVEFETLTKEEEEGKEEGKEELEAENTPPRQNCLLLLYCH